MSVPPRLLRGSGEVFCKLRMQLNEMVWYNLRMTYRFRFSAFQSLVSVLPKPLYLFLMLRFVGIKVFDIVCLVSPFLIGPGKFAQQHILLLDGVTLFWFKDCFGLFWPNLVGEEFMLDCFELLTTSVSKDKGFLPVKREKIKHQNGGICTDLVPRLR